MPSKPKATATREEARPAFVPKLRFPGFSTPWENAPLAKTLTEHRLKNTAGRDVFSVSMESGIVNQIEHLGRSFAAADTAHYTIGRRYDVVYTKSPLKAFPFGIVKQCKFDGEVALSPLYGVFTPSNKHVGLMIEAYFESPSRSVAFLTPLCQKGAKNTIQITNSTFLSGKMPLPTEPAEQQKIAECLSSVEELIAAQARKLDALKTHKKGLMQQLFPREGESQPRLRFPEFRDAGAWVVTKLNQLLFETKTRNRRLELGTADVLSVSGELGCVNQIDHLGRSYAGVSVKDYHVVEHGDIVYTKSPLKNNPFGVIKENKGKRGIVSTLYAVYRPFSNCSASYLNHFFSVAYNLNSYLQPIVKKGAKNDMKVNNADVIKGEICVPSFAEQRKISDCLSSMDAKIAAEARKLEALRSHKNGLMQRIFPPPKELKA